MTRKLAHYERELHTSHAAMAHGLRSSLTTAIGRLQDMLDGVFDASPEQLAMVTKQLQHLNRLTDELHLLSLSDAGNLILKNEPFRLDELFRKRATWIMPQADAHRLTVRLHHSQAYPFKGNTFRMGQVFIILMENALCYGHDGGHLDVTLHCTSGQYCLEFRSDGPGVLSQFLSEVFNRFNRKEQSRAHHSDGSSLGLSIACAICQTHGGNISAPLPETDGFAVTLPLPWTSSEMENSRS